MHLENEPRLEAHAHTSTPEHVAKTLILIQTAYELQPAGEIAILDSMDPELKQHLESIDTRLQAMDTRLQAMDGMEGRFMSALASQIDQLRVELKEHVSEELEKVETKLLTEFHKWGRTSDMRTRQAITDTGILGERMLAVEDRVSELERRRTT